LSDARASTSGARRLLQLARALKTPALNRALTHSLTPQPHPTPHPHPPRHIKEFIASCGTYANLVKQAKSKQKM
jgi:hypothetical protein